MKILWKDPAIIMRVCSAILNGCAYGIGPFLIMIAFALIGLLGYSLFKFALPIWFPSFSSDQIDLGYRESTITTICRMGHIIISIYLLYSICFHYIASILTDPGRTHEGLVECLLGEQTPSQGLTSSPILSDLEEPLIRRCRKCTLPKPARAHHCTICKRCIMKMDHHCPWIHNCVGIFNHEYFYLFLVYTTVATTYFSCLSMGAAWRVFSGKDDAIVIELEPVFILAFLMSTVMSPLLFGFVAWHSWLIGTGQTSIEHLVNQDLSSSYDINGESFINEYDLGTIRNFKEFFGISSSRQWWMVLIPMRHISQGNGLYYRTLRDIMSHSL
ncbi:hypothetical protein BDV3_000992 [Batrachochytrium dendrobatidis]